MTRRQAVILAVLCLCAVQTYYGLQAPTMQQKIAAAPSTKPDEQQITEALFQILRVDAPTVQPYMEPSSNAVERFVLPDNQPLQWTGPGVEVARAMRPVSPPAGPGH